MEQDKKKQILLITVVLATIGLLIAGIVTLAVNNSTSNIIQESEQSEENGERTKFLVFYNYDILNLAYNIGISSKVMENIELLVLSDAEMEFSGANTPLEENAEVYYDATIDVENFSARDMYTSKFRVTISDGRVYDVVMQADFLEEEPTYVYTAVKREGAENVSVVSYGDENGFSDFSSLAREMLN